MHKNLAHVSSLIWVPAVWLSGLRHGNQTKGFRVGWVSEGGEEF